ncbi:hypothetical protein GGF32_006461 [Allomyces javanicus]|nr:hypothetical protein GGF32_006461 [Allomyces javanicus]
MPVRRSPRLASKPGLDYKALDKGVRAFKRTAPEQRDPPAEDDALGPWDDEVNEIDEDVDVDGPAHCIHGPTKPYQPRPVFLDLTRMSKQLDEEAFAAINRHDPKIDRIAQFLEDCDLCSWIAFGERPQVFRAANVKAFVYRVVCRTGERKSFVDPVIGYCTFCDQGQALVSSATLGDDDLRCSFLNMCAKCSYRFWTFKHFVDTLVANKHTTRVSFVADFLAVVCREGHELFRETI